jgi:hypothetical protein
VGQGLRVIGHVPTFCRHNRFIERCPICSKTLPGAPAATPKAGARARSAPARPRREGGSPRAGAARAGGGVRVRRELRASDDGYRCELVPGVRASADAERLAREIAFSAGRLLALSGAPPDLYGEVRELGRREVEAASWTCLLIAYLCPLEGEEPFAGIREALRRSDAGAREDGAREDGAREDGPREDGPREDGPREDGGTPLPALDAIPLGPRSSHDPARGTRTLAAYRRWVAQAGTQQAAFAGDPSWTPERRFERLFERLSFPGLTRSARYELLVLLGRLGLCELRADSLQLTRGGAADDQVVLAAKRVFGIGDPLLLERRASALAQAAAVPVESLELALWNWGASERATLGFPERASDEDALARARGALGL